MSQFKASIGLAILLGIGSTQSLAALPGVAAVTGKDPAAAEKAEPLVQGGLLGAISSSIDDVQEKLDINEHLVEASNARRRSPSAPMSVRGSTVEHPFGTIKS